MKSKKTDQHNSSGKERDDFSGNPDDIFTGNMKIKPEVLQKIMPDIEELPPERWEIFKMIYIEGLSIFDVANKLEITVDSVRVQKFIALGSIRDSLEKKHYNS